MLGSRNEPVYESQDVNYIIVHISVVELCTCLN